MPNSLQMQKNTYIAMRHDLQADDVNLSEMILDSQKNCSDDVDTSYWEYTSEAELIDADLDAMRGDLKNLRAELREFDDPTSNEYKEAKAKVEDKEDEIEDKEAEKLELKQAQSQQQGRIEDAASQKEGKWQVQRDTIETRLEAVNADIETITDAIQKHDEHIMNPFG